MTLQTKKIRLPSKNMINLATAGEKKFNGKFFIPGIIIIAVISVAFAKFGVIDRYIALS